MAALLEQRLRMGLLEIAGADLGRRDLRGYGEHRRARAVAVEQPIDQVQIAGTTTAGADGEGTGEVGFGAGSEGGDLLVPDVHPLDLALAAQRVGQTVQTVADDAVDALDTGCREGFGELIGHGLCHRSLSSVDDFARCKHFTICTWRRVRPAMKSALIGLAPARYTEPLRP